MQSLHIPILFIFAILSLSCKQGLADKIPSSEQSKKIILAAKSQIGKTIYYDPAYVKLDYPNGDIPLERGVCTDVVIRSLRESITLPSGISRKQIEI